GTATVAIAPGMHVHSHNLATALDGTLDSHFTPKPPAPTSDAQEAATFQGYVRADGRVATRNAIWILPTVGCVARTATRIAAQADAALVNESA
ncbi:UxaA family hydrolase, partial [Acinetobacter baumannii]